MRGKLFSLAVSPPIPSLEDNINDFLESQQPHVTYISVSSSDIERVASVWYEEPHHRTVEQTMAELEDLVEEPGAAGNLAGWARGGEGRGAALMLEPGPTGPLSSLYPDPAVHILDQKFAKYRLFNASVERLASGTRWGE